LLSRSLLLPVFFIVSSLFVLPARAAFPVFSNSAGHAEHMPNTRILSKPVRDNRMKYPDDDRHSWPGAIAIAFALAGFALLASPVMLIPLAAGALAIIMGLIGTDKEHFKRRGMALAGIVAGAIVILALLI
jgi:hypothetical protein